MNYITIPFLVFFLPIVFVIHRFARNIRLKNIILLLASIFFYGCYDIKYILFLAVSILITYFGVCLAKSANSCKRMYVCTCTLNLLILLIFKYGSFTIGSISRLMAPLGIQLTVPQILLPVGLSFFVFQSSTYVFDTWSGKMEPEKNILNYALFVSFFPTITSGPIQRARKMLPQIRKRTMPNFREVEEAVFVFLWGAFLKMIIADRIAIFTDAVYLNMSTYGGAILILCALMYSLQIYADFSGYSYMAIAVAKLFGFHLDEKFHQPYLAGTIADFWRRWHISLTSWFTEYLYIPLGGNRRGKARKYFNILIVFLVSGFWHGVGLQYIVWGGIHAVFQIVGHITGAFREKMNHRIGIRTKTVGHRIWQRVFVFLIVSFAWIFFRASSVSTALEFIKQMFTVWNPWTLFDGTVFAIGLSAKEWNVLVPALGVLVAASHTREQGKSVKNIVSQNPACKILLLVGMIMVLVIYGIWGGGYSASSFIYAGF